MQRRRRTSVTGLGLAKSLAPALLWAGLGSAVHAQTPPRVVPPPGSPLPGIVPQEAPNLGRPLARPAAPVAPNVAAEGTTHPVSTVSVEGVTAFPDSAVAPLTANLVGPAIGENQAEAARRALVDLYRSKGYVYTTVRAVFDQDRLLFRVTEGAIVDVKIEPEGDVGPVGTQVLRFLNHLKGLKPLSSAELERGLLLAQDIPGLTVQSVLNPSEGDPGELTLIAKVTRKKYSGLVSADNRAFPLTGPAEGLAVLNFDSFSEYGERTQLSLFGAFNETNVFGQVSEELYLGGSGLKLKVYGGIGVANPSGDLKAIGYSGATRVLGGQLTYPWLMARNQRLNLVAALDATESEITNQPGSATTSSRVSYDSLRILRLGADYDLLDQVLGGGVNSVSGRFSQGLPILGALNNGDPNTSARQGEKIDFSKLSGELTRTQTLAEFPDGRSFKLRESFGGQFTGDLLPPSEKYYLGGPHFNSGYYFGQVSGDKAATVSSELQYNFPLPTPRQVPFELRSQVYLFYDYGVVWQSGLANGSNVALKSAGGGVRLFAGATAELDLEGVYRMSLYPNGQSAGSSPLDSAAFYWQLLYRF